MVVAAVCLYHKFGHCKYGQYCRHEHVDQLCPMEDCEKHDCISRHPRRCTYFAQYGLSKFGAYCSYLHDTDNGINEAVHDKIQKMEEKIVAFETKLGENEMKVEILETKVNLLKDI